MNSNGASQAAVLSRSEILALLDRGWLIRGDTLHEASLREAGYDLRIATDFCVTPDGKRHDFDGRLPNDTITLRPGDMALVSSAERLCLPPHIAAHIGIKFSYATNGILVLTGSFVDPGYGLEEAEWRAWENAVDGAPAPQSPQDARGGRLHFYLVNHGDEDFTIKLGHDHVVTLQFLPVCGRVPAPRVPRGQLDAIRSEFGFDGDESEGRPLRFGLLQSVERRLAEIESATRRTDASVKRMQNDIDGVRTATLPFIQLGLFLVGATLLGVVLMSLSSLDDSQALAKISRVSKTLGGAENLGLITIGSGLILIALSRVFSTALEGLFQLVPRKGHHARSRSDEEAAT